MVRLGDGLDCVTYRDGNGPDAETSAFVPPGDGGEGVPLFLAPALGLDGRSFELLAPACRGRRTVFWNTPNRLPRDGGLPALATLALEHAARAGLGERFVIGGSSLGGMLALTAAALQPERVRGLILFGTALYWKGLGPGIRCARLLHTFVPRRKYHRFLPRVMFPGGPHPLLDPLREQMRHRTKDHMRSVLAALGTGGGFDLRPLLERVTVPTLVVQGRRDRVARFSRASAYERLPDLEMVVLDDASHLPYVQTPEPVIDAVAAFLARIDGERKS